MEYFFCYDGNKNGALSVTFVTCHLSRSERLKRARLKRKDGGLVAGRKTKYKNKYADELVEYFMRFLEMRDDPQLDDSAERHGMVTIEIGEDGKAQKKNPPMSGYPSLIKFAIKIGVTPQTLNNWKDKHEEFAEACEFADAIQDEILNERALTGEVDGRVAMKIRELKIAARRNAGESEGSGLRLSINVGADDQDQRIEIQRWTEPINEDTEY